jgi:hypothetical protein
MARCLETYSVLFSSMSSSVSLTNIFTVAINFKTENPYIKISFIKNTFLEEFYLLGDNVM